MESETDVVVFNCGSPRDHKCNNDGPMVYGFKDGTVTEDEQEARRRGGVSWGSVTCSICGGTAMDRYMWEGP